jgi:hypothetical protein
MEAISECGEPIFKLTEAVDLDIDAGPIDFDTIAMEIEAIDFERVGMSAVEQLHRPADFATYLGPPAHG